MSRTVRTLVLLAGLTGAFAAHAGALYAIDDATNTLVTIDRTTYAVTPSACWASAATSAT